jgi:hypothetical protein
MRRNVRTSGFFFFLLLLALTLLSAGGHIVVGDEQTMFQVTESLLSGKGLAITKEELVVPSLDAYGFLPQERLPLETTSAAPGRDGKLYSKYGIGQSLAVIPLYLAGDWVGTVARVAPAGEGGRLAASMLNALVLAATGWLLARFAQEIGWRASTGRWLALAFLFGSFAWPYVKTFYPQPSVGLLLLAAVYCAYRWKKEARTIWVWGAGLSLGGMLLFRISEAVLLPVILAYLFLWAPKPRRLEALLPAGIPLVVALGLTAAYNFLRFGSFFSTGYAEVAWDSSPLYGLFGLLLSPGKGIFFYAPLLVISLAGWRLFAKRQRAEAWLIAGIWLSLVAFYAPYRYWTGGWNWGPRFLLPALPLGLLPAGVFLEGERAVPAFRRLAPKVFFGTFLALGIFLQLPAILVDHSRYLYMQVYGSSDPGAYARTILTPEMSPLWRQWSLALERVQFYYQSDGWQKASVALDNIAIYSSAQPVTDAYSLLQAEFLRTNTLDLWWLNHGIVNPSLPLWWVGLPWMLLIVALIMLKSRAHEDQYRLVLNTSKDKVANPDSVALPEDLVPQELIHLPAGNIQNSK